MFKDTDLLWVEKREEDETCKLIPFCKYNINTLLKLQAFKNVIFS